MSVFTHDPRLTPTTGAARARTYHRLFRDVHQVLKIIILMFLKSREQHIQNILFISSSSLSIFFLFPFIFDLYAKSRRNASIQHTHSETRHFILASQSPPESRLRGGRCRGRGPQGSWASQVSEALRVLGHYWWPFVNHARHFLQLSAMCPFLPKQVFFAKIISIQCGYWLDHSQQKV